MIVKGGWLILKYQLFIPMSRSHGFIKFDIKLNNLPDGKSNSGYLINEPDTNISAVTSTTTVWVQNNNEAKPYNWSGEFYI